MGGTYAKMSPQLPLVEPPAFLSNLDPVLVWLRSMNWIDHIVYEGMYLSKRTTVKQQNVKVRLLQEYESHGAMKSLKLRTENWMEWMRCTCKSEKF